MGRVDGRAEQPYVMLDRRLIELLDPDELALYAVLLSYLRSPERLTDRQLWPSQKEIARVYGRSVDAVQRVMKKLIARGLVHETQREGTSNLYRLTSIPSDRGTASGTSVATGDDPEGYRRSAVPDIANLRRGDTADSRHKGEEGEGEEGKDKNPVGTIASLSPTVPRKPVNGERDQIFIHLAHEHGVNADRLAQVAREHGATPQEFEGAWRMAEGTAPGADEYERGDENGFRLYLGAWIKAAAEVARDLANYRDKVQYDARQAEYAARGPCALHWQPQPCRGCAADAKAVSDDV